MFSLSSLSTFDVLFAKSSVADITSSLRGLAPLSVDKNQKRAFENKCKDIADVLETLGNLTKK